MNEFEICTKCENSLDLIEIKNKETVCNFCRTEQINKNKYVRKQPKQNVEPKNIRANDKRNIAINKKRGL